MGKSSGECKESSMMEPRAGSELNKDTDLLAKLVYRTPSSLSLPGVHLLFFHLFRVASSICATLVFCAKRAFALLRSWFF